MKQKAIPAPVLGPYERKHRPDLKPLVAVSLPRPPTQQTERPPQAPPLVKPTTPPTPPIQNSQTAAPAQPPVDPTKMPVKGKKQQELPPLPDPEPLAVLEDGTEIPLPFKPVDPFTALASSNPTIAFVMLRQLRDMKGPMPDTSAGALEVLDKLETGLRKGEDVSVLSDEIAAYIMGDDEHNELFIRLHDAHDKHRSNEIDKSRAKMEDFWHGCMRRSDLSVIEGMALMSYFNDQQKDILTRIEKKRVRSDSGNGVAQRESHDLVERVNRPTIVQNKILQRKFDEAPPQEREILRKLGFKLEHALKARITKTTTETQTVEIIQNGPGTNK